MTLFISNKGGEPIYEQICKQIKMQIIGGELEENQALPSIRNLAKDLRISVITTKRAYDELEREGFIYTVAGKGCFVAPKDLELIREQNLRRIEAHISEIIGLAHVCELGKEDIIEMIECIFEEE